MIKYDILYSISSAAKAMHVSPRFVDNEVDANRIPVIILDGQIMIRGKDLEEYINSRTIYRVFLQQ